MKRFKMDYSSYRGRVTLRDILRVVAVVLLVLVVLLGIALAVGQKYIVYRDGALRFDLPFFSSEGASSVPDPGDVSVVVKPAVSEPEPEPEPVPPEQSYMGAVAVPFESVLDGTAVELAKAAGADAVIVDMKPDAGALNWVSAEAVARNVRANSAVEKVNQTISDFNESSGLYAVARMSCLRDDLVGADWGCAVLDSAGKRFVDDGGLRWSKASNSAVRSYLANAAAELAALGFDEILLENFTAPDRGDMTTIPDSVRFDANSVEKLLAEVKGALEPYDALLAVHPGGEEVAFTIGNQVTAEMPGPMDAYADRIWLKDPAWTDRQLLPALEQGGLRDAADRVVLLVDALDPERVCPQGVLEPIK